jgi:hypothetical protein
MRSIGMCVCVCRFRDLGSIVSRHSCVKSSKYYIYHKRHELNTWAGRERMR